MPLSGTELDLLRVFLAVVDANGVANAQRALGRDASTISRALSQLEKRLSLHLCERGRQGFRLTPEGAQVHAQATHLLTALQGFDQTLDALKGATQGTLRLGIIDNILTDPHCPLVPALRRFYAPTADRGAVSCHVEVLSPEDMEHQLLAQQLDLGISVFEGRHAALHYQTLYQEHDHLYCAPDHPLASRVEDDDFPTELARARHVSRRFLKDAELKRLNLRSRDNIVFTGNLEAVATLILSGQYIGFLPAHYALAWVRQGELVDIAPERFARFSLIEAAVHTEGAQRPLIRALLDQLVRPGD